MGDVFVNGWIFPAAVASFGARLAILVRAGLGDLVEGQNKLTLGRRV
jgi:hypothetical protein